MTTEENFHNMFSADYVRIIQMVYNNETGQTTSDFIKLRGDQYVLVVNKVEIGIFESEEAAFYYWKTEFDCKPVEPIIEKPGFWARIFGKWA